MANSQLPDQSIELDSRRLSPLDRLISQFDRAVRTLHPGVTGASRPSPAKSLSSEASGTLNETERRHAAGLMRVNHTGEVCAQALYSGQSLTARSVEVRKSMLHSASEEEDHLAWCEERLCELGSRSSLLNPLFYAGSFLMGAAAGLVSDKFSLGFIEATEDRVGKHLKDHLQRLPADDTRSRAIVSQMIDEELSHGEKALALGGQEFTQAQKNLMANLATVMTATSYRI